VEAFKKSVGDQLNRLSKTINDNATQMNTFQDEICEYLNEKIPQDKEKVE